MKDKDIRKISKDVNRTLSIMFKDSSIKIDNKAKAKAKEENKS